jgi:SAM-dependent methyltransferase
MSGSTYGEDLAFIQARGFAGFASAAIAELLPKLSEQGVSRVVDVGCGAGVTTKALVEAGFETLAIEPAPALLAIAREAAPGATFLRTSAYVAELPPCDAVLALGEPLTYHHPDADADGLVRAFFRKVAGALRGGGVLIFDLIESEGEALDARGWASGPDWAVLHESREERATSYLVRRIETFRRMHEGAYRRSEEVHTARLFDRHSIAAWLDEEGFDVAVHRAYGGFELPRRRLAFIATRRT